MDEQAKIEDSARKTTSYVLRGASQAAGVMTETSSALSDAGKRLVDEMLQLSTATVREGTRILSDLQQIGFDCLHDAQDVAWRWQRTWPLAFGDPAHWWRAAVEESIRSAQRTTMLAQRAAQVVGESCLRLQRRAEQSGNVLQETLRAATPQTQEVYSKAERQRTA